MLYIKQRKCRRWLDVDVFFPSKDERYLNQMILNKGFVPDEAVEEIKAPEM